MEELTEDNNIHTAQEIPGAENSGSSGEGLGVVSVALLQHHIKITFANTFGSDSLSHLNHSSATVSHMHTLLRLPEAIRMDII